METKFRSGSTSKLARMLLVNFIMLVNIGFSSGAWADDSPQEIDVSKPVVGSVGDVGPGCKPYDHPRGYNPGPKSTGGFDGGTGGKIGSEK